MPAEDTTADASPADGVDRRLVVRPLTVDDFDAVVALHARCFPTMDSWTLEEWAAQTRVFPDGQIGVELDGIVVATSSSAIVFAEDYVDPHTYGQASGEGLFGNHTNDGDSLYGLDIAVDPRHRGMRLARRIYEARKQLCSRRNLKRIIIGARMPRLYRYPDLTPEAYLDGVLSKTIRDGVLTSQRANGFVVRQVLYGYLPEDTQSRGHAVQMFWASPDYRPPGPRPPRKMRVASVQYRVRPVQSFDEFAAQLEFFIDAAADYRADFVLFPELLTNQLLALVPAARPALGARRLHEFTGAYEAFFSEAAMRHAINIIAGSHLIVEDDVLYNVAYLFHRDGRIDRQRKVHITPAEARWWGVCAGDEMHAFDTDRGKIGIPICYDIEFPELCRRLRQQGALVLFVPYNTDQRSGHMRVRSCAQARCIENHVYVVTSGVCGNLPDVEGADIHYAQSAVLCPSDVHFGRDGILEEATPNVEMMLIADLDLDLLRRTERTGTVRPWVDRRLDLYGTGRDA
ncbi:MAG: putative amidohydrolase/ribosomal protein S18 acetylase RimI-like enzyme [Bradymonadia bacterium]|jgi:predicted amidohydrolase/ribosomal protein S18 acetylase RimI-like enzyme